MGLERWLYDQLRALTALLEDPGWFLPPMQQLTRDLTSSSKRITSTRHIYGTAIPASKTLTFIK